MSFRGHSAQISCPFCYTTHVFSHIIFYKYFIFNEKVGCFFCFLFAIMFSFSIIYIGVTKMVCGSPFAKISPF